MENASAAAAAAPTTSNNGAEVAGTSQTPEPPVLHCFWADDPANNSRRPAGHANNVDEQVDPLANPSSTGQEGTEVVRIHERVSGVPQIVSVRGNSTGRGKFPVKSTCLFSLPL